MTPTERIALIRARLPRVGTPAFKPSGLYCASTGLLPMPRRPTGKAPLDATISRAYRVADSGYEPQVGKKSEWISAPVRKPKILRVAPKKRRKSKYPLTRIAEQLPMKLPILSRISS